MPRPFSHQGNEQDRVETKSFPKFLGRLGAITFHVGHVEDGTGLQSPASARVVDSQRGVAQEIHARSVNPGHAAGDHEVAVAKIKCAEFGLAQFGSRPRQRVHDRIQIGRRAADDLQYVGGRSLLLEGFFEFSRFGLDLVE